jgi:serine/threonine protein kinase/putative intracellular protease/amidase
VELADHPRYRVVRVLGAGGMGTVYLAEHRLMGRRVAIKVIHPDLLRHPVAVKRFQVEVQAAARLDHPNIVRAHDAEEAGGLHFLVMEYVEGASLSRIIRERGPLQPHQACRCIRQVARGLQHACDRGMVHRDIKPQNLMFTSQGTVKILDFGLARFARTAATEEPLPAGTATGTGTVVTAAGSVFGTPDYIAPEQAQDSREVDIRADIYSLGCTLYFLLTGTPPFPDKPSAEKLAAHMAVPLPPLVIGGQPGPAMRDGLVARMTAKNPADRFATPAEVIAAIDEFLAVEQLRPSPPPAANRRAWIRGTWFGGIGLTAMAILGLGAWKLAPPGPTAAVRKSSSSPALPPAPRPMAGHAGPRVLLVVPEQFTSPDYDAMRKGLEAGGAAITVVSTGRCTPLEPSTGRGDVVPDRVLPQQPPEESAYDAIVLVGGFIHRFKDPGPSRDALWRIIDEALVVGKPVAALDTAQGILVIKGDLRTRRVAPSDTVRRMMPAYAAVFVDAPVVADRGILTAGSAAAAAELAGRVLEAAGPKARSRP